MSVLGVWHEIRPPEAYVDLGRTDFLGIYRARDAAYASLGLADDSGLSAGALGMEVRVRRRILLVNR